MEMGEAKGRTGAEGRIPQGRDCIFVLFARGKECLTEVAGLPLILRTALSGWRITENPVLVACTDRDELLDSQIASSLDNKVRWSWVSQTSVSEIKNGRKRFFLIPAETSASTRRLAELLKQLESCGWNRKIPLEDGREFAWGCQAEKAAELVAHFLSTGQIKGNSELPLLPESDDLVLVKGSTMAPVAEEKLLKSLTKDGDGFLTRIINRRVSRVITRVLMKTRVTPIQVTIASIVVGLISAMAFLYPENRILPFAGALLFWFSNILDGCDGELARLKFAESSLGGRIDFLGDNLVHICIFAAMSWGLYQESAKAHYLVAGALAVSGTLVSVGIAYLKVFSRRWSDPSVNISSLEGNLTNRDALVYGILLLTLLGRTDLLIWGAAIGTHIFWLTLILLGNRIFKA